MSSPHEISESRARAKEREAKREQARLERAAERKSARSGSNDADDPNDPLAEERRKWREKQRAKGAAEYDGMDDGNLTQEDQMIQHAKKLQSENAATLKNTIKVARETTVVGASTIQKLDQQTEQFHRMDQTLDETNDSLSRSERILRGMKSIGGAITNLFTSDKTKKTAAAVKSGGTVSAAQSTMDDLDAKDKERQRRKDSGGSSKDKEPWPSSSSSSSSSLRSNADIVNLTGNRTGGGPPGGSPISTGVQPNAKQAAAIQVFEANQREEDAALDELSDVLGTLKEQSQMMHTQLNQQAKVLERIDDKIDSTSARLKQGSRTMQKIS